MAEPADIDRFQSLFFNAPLPYQSLDQHGCLLDVNDAWLSTLGYTRDEVIGRSVSDFLTPASRVKFEKSFPRFKEAREIRGIRFVMVSKLGEHHEVAVDGYIAPFDSEDEFPGTHCIISDVTKLVTDLEDAQQRVRELDVRDRIAKAFLSCPGDEVYSEVLEVVLDVMESQYGVFGYIEENGDMRAPSLTRSVWEECEVEGKDTLFARDSWGDSMWARALREGRSLFENTLGQVPEGHLPIHRNLATPIVYDGEVIGLLHVANKETDYEESDTTRLEYIADYIAPVLNGRVASARAESALVESERRYRTIIDSTPIGFLLYRLNEAGELVLEGWNPYAQEVTGRLLDDMVDRSIEEIFPMLAPTEVPQAYKVVAETGQPFFLDRIDYDDGFTSGSYEVHAFQGDVGQVIVAFSDITERVRSADELIEHREHLEELVETRTAELKRANRAKGDFLAKMSHELRTPLNSIIGFTGILRQGMAGPLTEEQAKQLGMVDASSRHLLELINEILDLERIEAGRLELHLEEIDVADMVSDAVAMIEPMAEQRGLEISLQKMPGRAICRTDAQRVTQVLINLLSNAVKFTSEGLVEVTVVPGDSFVAVDVTDTGEGISAADIDRIFGEFIQLGDDLASRPAGTGLGLTVSRRIARLLGGDLVARSEKDRGSTFTFTIPCEGPENGLHSEESH